MPLGVGVCGCAEAALGPAPLSCSASATAGWMISPARTFKPMRRPGFCSSAASIPCSASSITYGSVAFVSAWVEVIGTFGITTKGEDNDVGEQPRKDCEPLRAPQERKAEDAVPVAHEVKLSEYEKGLKYLTATETDHKSKMVVSLFAENEKIDYTHELGEAKDQPEVLAKVIADIIDTGKKRRSAVKGEK